ncbi:3-phytase B [Penicillium atrosanguineum]|nr:3-phytase B [Penicillium atrosanguineum]
MGPKNIATLLGWAAVVTASYSNRPDYAGRFTFAAPYDQSFLEGYSILKHIGGLGPYSNRMPYGIGRDPPESCAVDQVIMIRRHGERYPQGSDGEYIEATLKKLYGFDVENWKGDLTFLNWWQYYMDSEGLYGLETESGPYNGLLTTYKHGAEYRVRYGHLWDQSSDKIVPMWTSGFERVVQTARKFGEGFFGWNYTDSVALNIISESEEMGANSLTPECPGDTDTQACDSLSQDLPAFRVAAERFNKQNPGLNLNSTDIFQLMFMSVFELNVRGYSDWTNAFTLDEWKWFGYTQDLQFYYCAGPGDPYYKAVGSVYANASLTLLNQGPAEVGAIYFNFAHDTNITPILAAMGIATPSEDLPLDKIPFPSTYEIGNIMPMGGHLTLERMSCNATVATEKGTFVRVVLNEAVVPFTSCQEGPGFSCSLANYTDMVSKMLPDFASECKINSTVPQHLSFWWDYNTTSAYNHQTAMYIPYQGDTYV